MTLHQDQRTPAAEAPARAWAPVAANRPTRPVIEAREVSKVIDGTAIVSGLTLDVAAGTVVGLIGPSGSGKTSAVRLLTGLYQPTSGDVTVWGTPPFRLSHAERQAIGYLPQQPVLFPELSLWQNLNFQASLYGVRWRRRKRLRDLLEVVELSEHRRKRVADASGGMRRRLALAATLAADPRLLFLDEPTAGIDPILRTRLWDQFRLLRDEGRTLVVTTQYVNEAAYCDVVALLSDGELIHLDTPAALRRAAHGGDVLAAVTADVVSESLRRDLGELPFVRAPATREGTTGLRLVVDEAGAAMPAVHAWLTDRGVEVVQLEQVVVEYDEMFVRLVERHREQRRALEDGEAA